MSPRSYGPLFTVKVVKTQLGADYLNIGSVGSGTAGAHRTATSSPLVANWAPRLAPSSPRVRERDARRRQVARRARRARVRLAELGTREVAHELLEVLVRREQLGPVAHAADERRGQIEGQCNRSFVPCGGDALEPIVGLTSRADWASSSAIAPRFRGSSHLAGPVQRAGDGAPRFGGVDALKVVRSQSELFSKSAA